MQILPFRVLIVRERASKMGDQLVQVAFLLDTRSTKSLVATRHRSLCLACTRVLLFLSGFPNRAHQRSVKWKYHFFSERGPTAAKTPHFLEQKLSCIEKMFEELYSELQGNAVESQCVRMAMTQLYSALVETVQGSVWDSPDILSPARAVGNNGGREGGTWQRHMQEREPQNMIFVCSSWPEQVNRLTGSLFPPDLMSFLQKQKISVFWLYEGDPSTNIEALTGVSEAVEATGGAVIHMSSLLLPLTRPTSLQSPTQPQAQGKQTETCRLCVETRTEAKSSCDAEFGSYPAMEQATSSSDHQPMKILQSRKKPGWLPNLLVSSPLPTTAFVRESITTDSNRFRLGHELLWLCGQGNHPVCIMQIEPLRQSTAERGECGLVSSIQNCSSSKSVSNCNIGGERSHDGNCCISGGGSGPNDSRGSGGSSGGSGGGIGPGDGSGCSRGKNVSGGSSRCSGGDSGPGDSSGHSGGDCRQAGDSRGNGGSCCNSELSGQKSHPSGSSGHSDGQSSCNGKFGWDNGFGISREEDGCSGGNRWVSGEECPPCHNMKRDRDFGGKSEQATSLISSGQASGVGAGVLSSKPSILSHHATIKGVLRQSDVPFSWLQQDKMYTSTGLHVTVSVEEKLYAPHTLLAAPHTSSLAAPHTSSLAAPHTSTLAAPHTSSVGAPHTSSLAAPHTSSLAAPHTSTLAAPHTLSVGAPHTSSLAAPHTSSIGAPHTSSLAAPHTSSLAAPHTSSLAAPHTSSIGAPHTSSLAAPHTSSPAAPHTSSPAAPQTSSLAVPHTLSLAATASLAAPHTTSLAAPHTSSLAPPVCPWLYLQPECFLQDSTVCYSKKYQDLCLWLAYNKMLLLLEVKCNSGHTGLCVLQPLTSVLCCLSLLKHHLHSNLTALLSKQCSLHTMHNPPPASTVPRAQLKNEPVRYADTASAGSKACCDESLAKYRASQPELYCSLQLLFFDSADRDGERRRTSSFTAREEWTLAAGGNVFTATSLLPWYPFVQSHGVPAASLDFLTDLQLAGKERDFRGKTQASMLCRLKAVQEGSEEICQGVALHKRTRELVKSVSPVATTAKEAIEMLKAAYNEQVQVCAEGLILQQWVSNSLHKLQHRLHGMEGEQLWPTVRDGLLLSITQLEKMYAERGQDELTHKKKLAEYHLQVLLRLEVCKLCGFELSDDNSSLLAVQITGLLRKISLLAKPIFLGRCMKDVIIPNYSTTCQGLLLSVCEALMLPVPVELGGSPDRSPSHTLHDSSSSPSSNDMSSLHSLQDMPSLPPTAATRSLVRCASFQDQRQITVPATKKSQQKAHSRKDIADHNVKRLKLFSEADISNEDPKKVCRSLFSRSVSLTADIGCKRNHEEEDNIITAKKNKVDFVVKETPVKKQVENYRKFKLQRLRSKVEIRSSAQVVAIEESPQRSFYSSKMLKVPVESSIQFETFPKRKSPSPSAIQSLLHGTMVLSDRDESTSTLSLQYRSPQMKCISKAARMLSYESEDPLTYSVQPPLSDLKTSPNRIVKARPVNLLTDIDPSISGDSASMAAFALSTPTKDDPINFQNALVELGSSEPNV